VVSGSPGSGKTTLAHELARAMGCPAICQTSGFKSVRADPAPAGFSHQISSGTIVALETRRSVSPGGCRYQSPKLIPAELEGQAGH